MPDPIEQALESALTDCCCFGQILIRKGNGRGFILSNRDDQDCDRLKLFKDPEDAAEIARYDDAGNYRALKTAPNLRHGWRFEIADLAGLRRALNSARSPPRPPD